MAGHFDFAPDGAHDALLVDEESGAINPHVFAPVHALLDPGAVSLAHFALEIGGERERQAVFRFELVVAGDAIAGDTDDGDAGLGELGHSVSEGAGLDGAARGHVLGIEVEDHFLAAQILQSHPAAAIRWQHEFRGGLADFRAQGVPPQGFDSVAATSPGAAASTIFL
jgi:hypothetical protein